MTSLRPSIDDIRAAAAVIEGKVHRTPVVRSSLLSEMVGRPVWFKCENLQKTGSFKVRGALNRMRAIPRQRAERGVVTVSAGNHAQAVAWAARSLGMPAVVCMPQSAPASKVDASRDYGAEIILAVDSTVAFETALELSRTRGLEFVHPFDDPLVSAGQGTTALEFIEAVPDLTDLVVPVGGGGLISGVGAAVHHLGGGRRVWGVEPAAAPTMSLALAAGSPVHLSQGQMQTTADGLAAPFAGELPLAVVKDWVEQVVLVSEPDIRRAMLLLFTRAKLVVEPAGAAGLAALTAGVLDLPSDARVGVVLSGGNLDPGSLSEETG